MQCIICGKETTNQKYCSFKCLGLDKSRLETALKNLPNQREWTIKELNFLRDNYGSMNINELSTILHTVPGNLIAVANRYGIKSARYWTKEQIDYLMEHHTDDYDSLCEHLHKSLPAINHKVSRLKLKRNARWTKSRLETEFEHLLKPFGFDYEYQYPIGNAVFDYFINGIAIEVQGNYWHCNPKFFVNGPVDDRQRNKVARDNYKKDLLAGLEVKLIEVWEDDIYNNKDYVKSILHGIAELK